MGEGTNWRRWHFANATLDERSLELHIDGRLMEIERKQLEVLRFLLAHADELLTKDQILSGVWPRRIMSDSVLAKCISRLREVLGDQAQELIRTVHGYGYRFTPKVRTDVLPETALSKQDAKRLPVLLVDDHELFRAGLKLLLADLAEGVSFADAATCESALALAGEQDFDIVLLDFHLPGIRGFEALHKLRSSVTEGAIVVLSAETDPSLIRRIVEEGAAGFIPKDSTHAVMMAALRLILAGGTYLPPQALLGPAPAVIEPGHAEAVLDELTHAQIETLRLALRGASNAVIARAMDVPEPTVTARLDASFRALQVQNRTEAVFVSARTGLVNKPPSSRE